MQAIIDTAVEVSVGGGLSAPYVEMSEREAIVVARSIFGIRGVVKRLATEKDDTFQLVDDGGETFVLKVANPSEDLEEIDFQVALLEHVRQEDPALPVPRVIRSNAGDLHTKFIDEVGQSRTVRLMTFLHGTPLDRVDATAKQREEIGKVLGRLRVATANFAHPGEARFLAWDVKHLLSLRPLLQEITDVVKREKLTLAMERYTELEPRFSRLRSQVLHNDFSKSNIVVDPALPQFVTGIIDFGDAVRTSVAIDVSTALLNQLPRNARGERGEDLFLEGKDVLRGYLQKTELTDEELALIPHLVMARVVARTLITYWRLRLFPNNATYIMRNTEQGWAQLDWFLKHSIQEVSQTFSHADFK